MIHLEAVDMHFITKLSFSEHYVRGIVKIQRSHALIIDNMTITGF